MTLRGRCALDFQRHGLKRPLGGRPKMAAPDSHRGPHALAARHRPDYPLSGCFPAEPNSVSSGTKTSHDNPQPLKAMPQRTLESMPPKIPPLNRQRSCPCIFFGGPFANPALRRVGLGHLAVGDAPRGPPRNGCRSADSPDGGGRRGFALFCLASDCLTLLPMACRRRSMTALVSCISRLHSQIHVLNCLP